MSLMRKHVLQNTMTLDIIAALQGGTCAIIQTKCSVFIFDESANVSSLLHHMEAQVNALNDTTQPKELKKISGSNHGALGRKSCHLFW